MLNVWSHAASGFTAAALLAFGSATAQVIIIGDGEDFDLPRPPSLLDFANAEPTLYSGASAEAFYQGSRRVPAIECNESFAFWSCREDDYSETLRDDVESFDGSTVSAERKASDFERTDAGQATSKARAATEFGSLRVEAYAANGSVWEETRVNSSEVPDTRSIIGQSSAGASAVSRSTEVLLASADGAVSLQFSLANHPGFFQPGGSFFANSTPLPADGAADLNVQVFNLDVITQYTSLSLEFQPIDGFLLVGSGSDGRDLEDPAMETFLGITFNAVAGQRYSIVSQLAVSASNDAAMNLFGTASLDRILVQPGQVLSFASGTAYDIAVVPVPAALPMLLGGLGLLAAGTRRRARGVA
jgi:hypothetical protein